MNVICKNIDAIVKATDKQENRMRMVVTNG